MRGTTKEDGKEEGGLVTDGREETPEEFQHCDPKSSGSEPLEKSLGRESGRERGVLIPRNTKENERKPRNHDCPHCQYSTAQSSNLKKHVNAVHLGEKPHQCPHCDYRTAVSSSLKRHVSSVHQGWRPHHCPHCDYRAAQSSDLKNHVSAVHLHQKPHRCDQCEYRAMRSTHLQRHIRRIHGPPPKPEEDGEGGDTSSSTESDA